MRVYTFLLFLFPVSLFLSSRSLVAEEASPPDFVEGFIQGKSAFALGQGKEKESGTDVIRIYQAGLSRGTDKALASSKYEVFPQYGIADLHYRWRIAAGCFWGTAASVDMYFDDITRIPLDELKFFDPTNREK